MQAPGEIAVDGKAEESAWAVTKGDFRRQADKVLATGTILQ